jgi:FkbM family methyltransferase
MRKVLCALQASRDLSAAKNTARYPIEFRSQFGEDVLLFELFEGKLSGAFIEVGAFDGYHASVSYAFEAIGWHGVLIEPIPEQFEACKSRRKHAHVANAALGEPGGPSEVTFTVVQGAAGEGMLSYDASRADTTEHVETIRSIGAQTQDIAVPLTTMDAVLQAASANGQDLTAIDFAVIDVEGSEMSLLGGFDLDRWKPRVLVVEDNTMGRSDEVLSHLRSRGYVDVMTLGLNLVFVRREEGALRERAKRLSTTLPWPNFDEDFGRNIGSAGGQGVEGPS